MAPTVYIETTVVSYLTARPSRDLVVAGHQQITADWWEHHLPHFEPFISPVVMEEISRGEPQMAAARIEAVSDFALLEVEPAVEELAGIYATAIPLPKRALADGYHLALATSHGMDFLATWNCSHMASGFIRRTVGRINASRGLGSPTICTPEELMETQDA